MISKISVCVCVRQSMWGVSLSHLEILPLRILVLVTVCDDNGRVVGSSGQTLVVLHQLIGCVDAEQLHRHTKTVKRWMCGLGGRHCCRCSTWLPPIL